MVIKMTHIMMWVTKESPNRWNVGYSFSMFFKDVVDDNDDI